MKEKTKILAPFFNVFQLANELCNAVDAQAEDIGGHRSTGKILAELGPACDACISYMRDNEAGQKYDLKKLEDAMFGSKAVGSVGTMPGTNGGFTMAVFKAADVPVGTKLYAKKKDIAP